MITLHERFTYIQSRNRHRHAPHPQAAMLFGELSVVVQLHP